MSTTNENIHIGAKVLIVGIGPYPHIVHRLVALGIDLYIADVPESPWGPLVEEGVISSFVPFNLYQRKNNLASDIVKEVRLSTDNVQFDAVTTYHDDHLELALRVADAYGVARNDVNAGTLARNKGLARKTMEEAGLAVVKHATIRDESDIVAALESVPFPAVLKPSFGFHSIAVKRLDTKEELIPYYEQVKGGLDGQGNAIFLQGVHMILEEYLDGEEVDVDILLFGGEVLYAGVVDNHRSIGPWFPEMGAKAPSSLSEDMQQELRGIGTEAAIALGYRYGVVDVEVRLSSRGPRVLEVNGRPPCFPNPIIHFHTRGINLVEAHITAMLGIPDKPYVSARPLSQVLSVEANAPYSGTICRDDWLDFIKDHENVINVTYMKKVGDEVVGPEDALPSLIGRVILRGDDMKKLLQLMGNIFNKEAEVPIVPKDKNCVAGFHFNTDC